ncbi:MAG: protein-export chaperone SecB [Thermoanaerobacterium sp.]|nr:protein-export chaperone SecB [Thermoanaerobacterium sp.]
MEDKYKEFIKNVELLSIYLSELDCKRSNDNTKFQKGININFNYSFEVEEIEEKGFNSKAIFKIIGITENVNVLEIYAEFRALYGLKAALEIDKELIEKFVKVNLPLNIWPYARELISSMTIRMGLPPLILNTYKIV